MKGSNLDQQRLIQLLRLAIILTHGRLNMLPQLVKMAYQQNALVISLTPAILQQSQLMGLLNQEMKCGLKSGLALAIADSKPMAADTVIEM